MRRMAWALLAACLWLAPSGSAGDCEMTVVFFEGNLIGWNCTGQCPGTEVCNITTVDVGDDQYSYCWCGDPLGDPPPPPGPCHGKWWEYDDDTYDLICDGYCPIKEACSIKTVCVNGFDVLTCDCQ